MASGTLISAVIAAPNGKPSASDPSRSSAPAAAFTQILLAILGAGNPANVASANGATGKTDAGEGQASALVSASSLVPGSVPGSRSGPGTSSGSDQHGVEIGAAQGAARKRESPDGQAPKGATSSGRAGQLASVSATDAAAKAAAGEGAAGAQAGAAAVSAAQANGAAGAQDPIAQATGPQGSGPNGAGQGSADPAVSESGASSNNAASADSAAGAHQQAPSPSASGPAVALTGRGGPLGSETGAHSAAAAESAIRTSALKASPHGSQQSSQRRQGTSKATTDPSADSSKPDNGPVRELRPPVFTPPPDNDPAIRAASHTGTGGSAQATASSGDPASFSPAPAAQASHAPGTPLHTTASAAHAAPGARAPLHTSVHNQIAVHMGRAAVDGTDRITIHLKPDSLGRVDIRMDVAHDGRLTATITADRPETLDMLQRDVRSLERAFLDAGLKADSGSLSFHLRGEGRQGGETLSNFSNPEREIRGMPHDALVSEASGGGRTRWIARGILDIHV